MNHYLTKRREFIRELHIDGMKRIYKVVNRLESEFNEPPITPNSQIEIPIIAMPKKNADTYIKNIKNFIDRIDIVRGYIDKMKGLDNEEDRSDVYIKRLKDLKKRAKSKIEEDTNNSNNAKSVGTHVASENEENEHHEGGKRTKTRKNRRRR